MDGWMRACMQAPTHHGSLGDGVLDLGQGDAHAKLGSHESEGVARGLGRQR